MASDLSVVSERQLGMLLYPIVGWSTLLLGFYGMGHVRWGLLACFPLAAWLGGFATWWYVRTRQRATAGEVSRDELAAGVRTVGHVMAGAALTPAVVFLADDPFAPSAWSATGGVTVLAVIAYVVVSGLARLSQRPALALALLLSWTSLPVNAMGAVTMATMLGWYDVVAEHTPIPELPDVPRR